MIIYTFNTYGEFTIYDNSRRQRLFVIIIIHGNKIKFFNKMHCFFCFSLKKEFLFCINGNKLII
jgi:hypothetical protein